LINLGFITEGKLADVLITPSLGVLAGHLHHQLHASKTSTSFLVLFPGTEEEEAPTSRLRHQRYGSIFR
jgi:hypothetical protein